MISTKKKNYPTPFLGLASTFEKKLKDFNPSQNTISIEQYFGKGKGITTALKLLSEDGIIQEAKDFKGLYIFYKDDSPFYVGISQKVIGRLLQHVKGTNHHSASFAYKIGKANYLKANPNLRNVARKGVNFSDHVQPAQGWLMQQKVAIIPIEDSTERYLFEVYCAMKLRTPYNDFETH